MRSAIAPILLSWLLLVPAADAATTSTFDSSAEDWRVLRFDNDGVFDADLGVAPHDAAFGNLPSGPGSISATDPGDDFAARFGAPAAFLGDKSALIGGTLSFDLVIKANDGDKSLDRVPGLVVLVNDGADLALGFTGALPTTDWSTYTVPLEANGLAVAGLPPIGSWVVFDPANPAVFAQASAGDFATVFANLTALTITGEVTDGTDDTLALDNVSLVPIPAPLVLLGSALFGLFVAARRNG